MRRRRGLVAVAVAAASVLLLASLVFAAASTAVEDTVQARKPPPRTISEGRDSNHSTLHTHEHTSDGCLCARPSLTSLVKRVKSAVVTIHVYNDNGEVVSQGSGWFITERVVVSTRHTFWKEDMQAAAYCKVTTNGPIAQQYLVKSVLVDDRSYDVVLLEVLPVVPVSELDGDDNQLVLEVNAYLPEEGEDVFVISSPLGLPGVISTGIVSALHNDFDLQTSCAVSTGSSGAPIFDYSGRVVGIVTGHLSTGQNLNFGLTVRALASVIAKLRPSFSVPPGALGLPAPRRPGTPVPPPVDPNAQVSVYDTATAAHKDKPPRHVEENFDMEVNDIEMGREREWCYPTLSEWVSSQTARHQEQGMYKWWRGWRRFLANLWSKNATDESSPAGEATAPGNVTPPARTIPSYPEFVHEPVIPNASDPLNESATGSSHGAVDDPHTDTTIVDRVRGEPQTPAPRATSSPSQPNASKNNETQRGYSPENLLEDIASLRLCTKRPATARVTPLANKFDLGSSDADGEGDDNYEDLDSP